VGGGDAIVECGRARLEALAGWGMENGGENNEAISMVRGRRGGLAVIGFVILKRKPHRRTDAKELTAEERKTKETLERMAQNLNMPL
jgi:hypothetical protein